MAEIDDPFNRESGITVGELIRQLQLFSNDTPVCFGSHGHFTYFRVKDRGNIAQIEFNESEGVDYTLEEDHPYRVYLKQIGIIK